MLVKKIRIANENKEESGHPAKSEEAATNQNTIHRTKPAPARHPAAPAIDESNWMFRSNDIVRRSELGTDRLSKLADSYENLLSLYAGEPRPEPDKKNTIIAVGGSKGGVGKSLFAANLGVLLAARGYKTVVVDLDLGGANLPLYLGENYLLKRTINDFLQKKYADIDDIMIKTKHGPMVMAADSSQLGSANIHFAHKIKLLRAIKQIEADYIVLDLGGDTSYNSLDFFLASDVGIVMTTRDSASYIGAYQFIKTVLYRMLSRLDSSDSSVDPARLKAFKHILGAEEVQYPEKDIARADFLVERIRASELLDQPLILKTVLGFNPHLVVNKVTNADYAVQVAKTIRVLSKKRLALDVDCCGFISHQRQIENSFNTLAPIAAKAPDSRLAKEISVIIDRLILSQ